MASRSTPSSGRSLLLGGELSLLATGRIEVNFFRGFTIMFKEKMIEAEQVKRDNAATPMDLKLDFTMAKHNVEDSEIQTRGLQKSLLMVQQDRAKSQMSMAVDPHA